VVTGRLVDEDGEPVSGATVRLLRQRYVSGQRRLSSSVAAPDTTNDRGEFRIYGIPPGTYFLSGTQAEPGEPGRPPNGLDSRDAVTTFYPGTPSPDTAQPVTVGPGQELSGLTLRSLPPPRLASISVTLSTPDTSRLPGKALELTRRLATGASSSRTAGLGPDGSFTWMNLPPGEYDISSRALLLRSGEFARAHVTLDGVDAKVALSLVKGGTVRGRVTLDADAGSQPPQPGSLRIGAVSTDPAETTATAMFLPPNADMTFEGVLTPGTRLLRPSLPGWVTKRIRVGDLDITDTPLDLRGTDVSGIEIVLTNRLTDVTGTITDASGRQTGDATVVLFADDASKWGHQTRFVAVVRPNQNGRFTQRGLPPARYVAVALEYLEPGEETNPETLKRLQGLGVRFTLDDRESKTLGLTLTNLP
jgi:hypothetical protein